MMTAIARGDRIACLVHLVGDFVHMTKSSKQFYEVREKEGISEALRWMNEANKNRSVSQTESD